MTDAPDLLSALATNGWQLDKQRDQPKWRCMWWCQQCGVWRCVVESGEWFDSPQAAIAAAIMSGK